METHWTHHIRTLVNWVNLSTLSGLLIAVIGRAQIHQGPQGLIFAENYRFEFPYASAFTVGNVVITARTIEQFEKRLPKGLVHEAKHSTQYAWLGPLFLPFYVIAMGVSWVRTRDRASWNPFEIHAGLEDGGYKKNSTRKTQV
ncbi:MAG: hypothetical protein LBG99_06055 [Propionibacteriaceae bacterium]|jgi:hypothetical protein|nr:hypothetical protein [Propionibacteriaceae bacterium]